MMFLWFPFLFLIPFAIFWMIRPGVAMGGCGMMHSMNAQTAAQANEDPNEIARKRLARGEITPAEYEEIRRAISN